MFTKTFFKGISSIRLKYTYAKIRDITDQRVGESFTIKGWVKANRPMKKIHFVDVNDGSTHENLQILFDKNNKLKASNIGCGSSISASGKLSKTPKGQLELLAEDVTLIGSCLSPSEGYPFVPGQRHPPDYIRSFLHLRAQVSSTGSMLRVRHQATKAFHNYLDQNGFIHTQTPILTSNDCEGAGEIFVVKPENEGLLLSMKKESVPLDEAFFDQKAFLAVSGQLHLEALVHNLGAVYTFGPAFRAENSTSSNHLVEFTMLEAEEAFIDDIETLAARIDDMMRTVTRNLLDTAEHDIRLASGSKDSTSTSIDWLDKPFPRLTFAEATKILEANADKLEHGFQKDHRLNREQELFLVKHVQGPLFVIDWPKDSKPFYMREHPGDPNLVEALDFLVPHVGELVGGGLREHNYERLEAKLPSDDLQWYLDFRKCGGCNSGGFGLGFERYLKLITGIENVKDVIPFPRYPHNCSL